METEKPETKDKYPECTVGTKCTDRYHQAHFPNQLRELKDMLVRLCDDTFATLPHEIDQIVTSIMAQKAQTT